ncbi:lytic transglycosylase domain-containing protein [Bartonella sp. DGB1]|uniref:lytic transglycosylase domain-containing protein n=1 Tax=Bartonella sp. DGB1 TaxID=3239807 RepID=UPI003525EC19
MKKIFFTSLVAIMASTSVAVIAAPLTQEPIGIPTAQERVTKKIHAKASTYDDIITKYAQMYNVPSKLVHAVIRYESSYNPKAVGGVGEIGLMQIRPETAKFMGYKGTTAGLYDPETNIRYGVKYLAGAHRLSGGDICGTILKYNAGHGAKRMNPISAKYCQVVKGYIA